MKIPFFSLDPRSARSVAVILHELSEPFIENNMFLRGYHSLLAGNIQRLNAALAKFSGKELTAEAKELDLSYGKRFSKLRRAIRLKAGDEDFGAAGESCAVLAKSIKSFGGNIEDFTRECQLNAMDQLVDAWSCEGMQNHIAVADVKQLYKNVVSDHKALKEVEQLRAVLSSKRADIPGTWPARDEAIPVIRAIYNHIKDFAVIDENIYGELYKKVVVELKPIIRQVNADQTRRNGS